MRRGFIAILLLFLTTSFADEYLIIDSDELNFDPESGIVKAEEVKIEYVEGSILTSPYGELDTQNRSALFSADEHRKVEYQGKIAQPNKEEVPFTLRCQKMLVNTHLNPSGETAVEISAKGNVYLDIPKKLKGKGEFAQLVQEGAKERRFLFTSIRPENRCSLIDPLGNEIKAAHIEMNLNSSEVNCRTANGTLFHEGKPLNFFCEELKWDDQKHQILLKEDILLDCQGFGVMTCSDQMSVLLSPDHTRKPLLIKAEGQSTCYHTNDLHAIKHTIICNGEMVFDREKKLMTMKGADGTKVKFQDDLGEIEASKVSVRFIEDEMKKMIPSRIVMSGSVRMKNLFSEFFHEETLTEQYALCDQVVFDTLNKKVIFRSRPKNRVLFFNKTNGLQVSAPELVMYRGQGIHPNIEGKGNVRLKLSDREMDLLRKAF